MFNNQKNNKVNSKRKTKIIITHKKLRMEKNQKQKSKIIISHKKL